MHWLIVFIHQLLSASYGWNEYSVVWWISDYVYILKKLDGILWFILFSILVPDYPRSVNQPVSWASLYIVEYMTFLEICIRKPLKALLGGGISGRTVDINRSISWTIQPSSFRFVNESLGKTILSCAQSFQCGQHRDWVKDVMINLYHSWLQLKLIVWNGCMSNRFCSLTN